MEADDLASADDLWWSWAVLAAYPLAVYAFTRVFCGRAVAGYAALGGALLPSAYLAGHTFGPLPTTLDSKVLDAISGYGILAPTVDLTLSGNVKAMYSNIIAYTITLSGNNNIQIQDGSMLSLSTSTSKSSPSFNITGNCGIDFKKTDKYKLPTFGFAPSGSCGHQFILLSGTYFEPQPPEPQP